MEPKINSLLQLVEGLKKVAEETIELLHGISEQSLNGHGIGQDAGNSTSLNSLDDKKVGNYLLRTVEESDSHFLPMKSLEAKVSLVQTSTMFSSVPHSGVAQAGPENSIVQLQEHPF